MASLIKKQHNRTVSKSMKTRLKQRLIITVTLSIMLGLGWGLGIPATEGIDNLAVRTTFQIVFIFLTAFQGLFIFIMHCMRVPDARKEWKYWFNKLTFHSEVGYSKSTLSRSGPTGFVYKLKKVPNKTGTLTTSVAGGDSSTLRQSFESSTFTKGAISAYESSTLRSTGPAFFASILESETAFNESAAKKDEGVGTIFEKTAADLGEESSLADKDSPLPGDLFKDDLSVDPCSNATPKVAPIEQTATEEISPAGKMHSAQLVSMHKDEADFNVIWYSSDTDKVTFDVWYNINPDDCNH